MVISYKKVEEKFSGKLKRNGTSICINVPAYLIRKHNLSINNDIDVSIKFDYIMSEDQDLKDIQKIINKYKLKNTSISDLLMLSTIQSEALRKKQTIAEILQSKKAPKEFVIKMLGIDSQLKKSKKDVIMQEVGSK